MAMKVVTTLKPTPASFATEPYFGVNTFLFTNGEGNGRYGRYQFRPDAGSKFLTDSTRPPRSRPTSSSMSWATGSPRAQ